MPFGVLWPNFPADDVEGLGAQMRMNRRLGPRWSTAVVDAQQVLGRGYGRYGSDFGHLRPAGRRRALRPKREQPRFAGDFGRQRWPPVVAHRVRVPTVLAGRGLRLIQRRKILDPPVQRALRKLLDLHFGDRLDDVLHVRRPNRWRQQQTHNKMTGIAIRAADGSKFMSPPAALSCRPHVRDGAFCLSGPLNFGLAFPPFFLWALILGSLRAQREERKVLALSVRGCALDPDRRELRRGTTLVAIEPQVFDLLVHLIRHRDRVVSKDELLASVWHGRAISESALFNRINAARSAIGDTGARQELIKTLPRRGLRFVGAVREEELSRCRRPDQHRPSPGIADKPSIAVLPFVNLSGDPEQDYFIDGIVEDIITALSRNRAFSSSPATRRSPTRASRSTPSRSPRELGVRYVLEGSVRKSGNRVRVTGQLIEAESGHHLWADRFDGDLVDIFDLQDQLVTKSSER